MWSGTLQGCNCFKHACNQQFKYFLAHDRVESRYSYMSADYPESDAKMKQHIITDSAPTLTCSQSVSRVGFAKTRYSITNGFVARSVFFFPSKEHGRAFFFLVTKDDQIMGTCLRGTPRNLHRCFLNSLKKLPSDLQNFGKSKFHDTGIYGIPKSIETDNIHSGAQNNRQSPRLSQVLVSPPPGICSTEPNTKHLTT